MRVCCEKKITLHQIFMIKWKKTKLVLLLNTFCEIHFCGYFYIYIILKIILYVLTEKVSLMSEWILKFCS